MHARGGCIVAQLWHVGRISHTSLLPQGVQPVAPSALRANAKTFTRDGFVDVSQPRVLELDEISAIVDSFPHAARNAIEAGFDGVEIHGANGYLIDQFLRNGANRRQDAYGGSIENRTRFLVEVMGAVAEEIGAGRVGVRLSPVTPAGDLSDSDPQPLFERAVQRLDALGIAYIHVIEGATGGDRDVEPFDYAALGSHCSGAWIVNNGYDHAVALDAMQEGQANAVAFGVPFLANPDLPARLRQEALSTSLIQPSSTALGRRAAPTIQRSRQRRPQPSPLTAMPNGPSSSQISKGRTTGRVQSLPPAKCTRQTLASEPDASWQLSMLALPGRAITLRSLWSV